MVAMRIRTRRLLLIALSGVAVALAVGVWLLRPADRVTADNCERIRAGMTAGEVEALLGSPADDEARPDLVDGSVTRLWNGGDGSILVVSQADGIVLRARFVRESHDAPKGSGWLGWLFGRPGG
jgi:hypothetical protein